MAKVTRGMVKVDYMLRDRVVSKVRTIAMEKTFQIACGAAAYASQMTYEVAMTPTGSGCFGFYNVTGNLLASMGFTVSRYDEGRGVHTRARSYAPISGHKRPLGRSLEGLESFAEVYGDIPYYSGISYETMHHKPYIAPKSGLGGSLGTKERAEFIREIPNISTGNSKRSTNRYFKASRGNFWTIFAYVSMPYAGMVEGKKGHGHIASLMADFVADALENPKEYLVKSKNQYRISNDTGTSQLGEF